MILSVSQRTRYPIYLRWTKWLRMKGKWGKLNCRYFPTIWKKFYHLPVPPFQKKTFLLYWLSTFYLRLDFSILLYLLAVEVKRKEEKRMIDLPRQKLITRRNHYHYYICLKYSLGSQKHLLLAKYPCALLHFWTSLQWMWPCG